MQGGALAQSSKLHLMIFAAGLVGALGGAATSAAQSPSVAVQRGAEGGLVCASNKSVGTMGDFVGTEGLPVDQALAEARRIVLRNRDELGVTSSKRVVGTSGNLTFTFQNQKNETVAAVSLAPIGSGWRFDGGGRCVSGDEA